ncbi:jerky protein homolog-like [Daphnia carinata]|uniref:jerky protein homolog-like n=1 Tax=Daphnia carinata TaxID=120202 RepID=UPI00257D767B|nr:jerky protein homolog-like [Daphnia carinata]
MIKLRNELSNFAPDHIFNMDETGLFYRCMPNRSYVLDRGDKRQKGKGTKAMKSKDRITLVLCVKATDTCKIDPLIIGTAKTSHGFRDNRCPLPYTNQSRAWVQCFTNKRVALVMDSCSGHDKTIIDPTGQVSTYYFPPNVTSIYQLLDQGIIAALKTRYMSKMLAKLVESYDNFEALQLQAEQIPNGRRGLSLRLLDLRCDNHHRLQKPGLDHLVCSTSDEREELLSQWLDIEQHPDLLAAEEAEMIAVDDETDEVDSTNLSLPTCSTANESANTYQPV